MNVTGIKIKNVLGVEDLQITPEGNIIQISGHNGAGKTSVMEAIKSACGTSDYSTLLRNGAEKGEVVLDVGDMLITKKFNQKGETLSLKGKVVGTDSFSTISSPAKVLKSLVNPNSVDPVRLLTSKPRELLDAVIGALPMTVDTGKIADIVGSQYKYNAEDHALITIGNITKEITEERKLLNRDAKTAKTTGDQLAATLPDVIPSTEELQCKIEDNLVSMEGIKQSARKAGREARTEFTTLIQHKQTKIESLDEEMQELEDKIAELQTLKHEVTSELRVLESQKDSASEAAMEKELDKEDAYREENVAISEAISRVGIHENTAKQVREWKNKEASAVKASDVLTKQLKGLQGYKEDLCSDLPIEGLAITDGMLSMNGIPFATLNTAARVDLVIELAKLSAGKLGIVVLDNSEMLDSESYKMFLEKAAKTDLTFVVARVEDHDLEIKC